MAGGHGGHSPVKIDAGVEAWAAMRENVYKTFRFTPRTTRIAFFWGAVVPLAAYYAISGQDLKWDWQGKKRDQSLLRGHESQQ